jgi:hypothetical protein
VLPLPSSLPLPCVLPLPQPLRCVVVALFCFRLRADSASNANKVGTGGIPAELQTRAGVCHPSLPSLPLSRPPALQAQTHATALAVLTLAHRSHATREAPRTHRRTSAFPMPRPIVHADKASHTRCSVSRCSAWLAMRAVHVAYCTSRAARRMLHVACCTSHAARCMLHVACCTSHVARRVRCAVSRSSAGSGCARLGTWCATRRRSVPLPCLLPPLRAPRRAQ